MRQIFFKSILPVYAGWATLWLRYVNKNGAIMVESEKTSSHFIISISNDGPPIEEKYLNKIFDRFYKVDFSRNPGKEYLGSGLGLSIVNSIMKLHDGYIAVKNLPFGKGVKFSLLFPLPH